MLLAHAVIMALRNADFRSLLEKPAASGDGGASGSAGGDNKGKETGTDARGKKKKERVYETDGAILRSGDHACG